MKTFRYTVIAFRDGKPVMNRLEEITGDVLELRGFEASANGLLRLLNGYNRSGLLGVKNGGPIYVYFMEPTP